MEELSEQQIDLSRNNSKSVIVAKTKLSSASVNSTDSNVFKKEDILQALFGDVGEWVEDYSCAVESSGVLLHGRMYVTVKFLCFYSNLFGLEKKIRIPFLNIKEITKENTALVIPNAISVSTYRKDSTKEYIFRSFWDRDDCHRVLIEVLSNVTKSAYANLSISGSERGFNSISSSNMSVSEDDGSQTSAPSPKSKKVAANDKKASLSSHSLEIPIELDSYENNHHTPLNSILVPNDNVLITTSGKRNQLLRQMGTSQLIAQQELSDEEFETEKGSSRTSLSRDHVIDFSSLFREEVAHSRLKLVMLTESLPVSLNEFFVLFVQDNAPHSYANYYELNKNTDIICCNWSEMSATLGYSREIKLIKPLNVPGLPSTRCTNVQRYKRFGSFGLVICSSTRMEDVPAASTFSVEDMLSVRSVPAVADGIPHVVVEITFEVKFIQSTMFRYMIENSTTAEMQKWFKDLFIYLKSVCEDYRLNPSPDILQKVQEMNLLTTTQYDAFDTDEILSQRSNISNTTTTTTSIESNDFIKNVEKDAPIVTLTTLATFIDYVLNIFQFFMNMIKIFIALEQKVIIIIILLIILLILIGNSIYCYIQLNNLKSTVQLLLVHQKRLENQIEEMRSIRCS